MFRAIILPIFRSTRLCVTACGIMHPQCFRSATGLQHRGCLIPQAVTHSLLLLKMGKIISWNMLSWLELLINRYFCILLVVYIIYINDARSSKYQTPVWVFTTSKQLVSVRRRVLFETLITANRDRKFSSFVIGCQWSLFGTTVIHFIQFN